MVNGTGRPRRGWRLVKIEYNDAQHFPASPGAMLAAFENATNLRQEEVKVTFDCAEEEDFHADFHADGHDVHDGHDDTPEGDPLSEAFGTPNLPVVEPSIYLTIIDGAEFQLGGVAPHVRLFWCEKEVSRTAPGRLDKHNQPHWNAESFLLPLPENTDDVGLRLEVWTTTCHGQALLEGQDLLRQCFTDTDKRAKRATRYQLTPHRPVSPASERFNRRREVTSSLALMMYLISPAPKKRK